MAKIRYQLIALLLIPTLIADPRVVSAWTVSTASRRTPSACDAFSPEAFAFSGCAVFIGPHRSSISGIIHLASLVATKPDELLHSAGIQIALMFFPFFARSFHFPESEHGGGGSRHSTSDVDEMVAALSDPQQHRVPEVAEHARVERLPAADLTAAGFGQAVAHLRSLLPADHQGFLELHCATVDEISLLNHALMDGELRRAIGELREDSQVAIVLLVHQSTIRTEAFKQLHQSMQDLPIHVMPIGELMDLDLAIEDGDASAATPAGSANSADHPRDGWMVEGYATMFHPQIDAEKILEALSNRSEDFLPEQHATLRVAQLTHLPSLQVASDVGRVMDYRYALASNLQVSVGRLGWSPVGELQISPDSSLHFRFRNSKGSTYRLNLEIDPSPSTAFGSSARVTLDQSDNQTLEAFRFEPRVAVVPGGMDIRIFDYFPNLEKAYYLNVRPFRVSFQIALLRYNKYSSRKPLEGQQAYDRMMEDYLAESPDSFITSATQNDIAHNPAHSQIGFEPFILADLERSGNTHIRVDAVVETIDDPITWRIHFQNPAGAAREIIYSETNVFSGHLPQSLRDDISQQRIGLLFCKAFDPEYVEGEKTLAPDLLSLPPGALVARDNFPLDTTFDTPHFLPLAWLKGLTPVGVLGGRGTFLGHTGHFGRMVVGRMPDGQSLEQVSETPLVELTRRIDRQKARLTAMLRRILEPLQDGQRTVDRVQALLNPHDGAIAELIHGLKRLFLEYAVLINDEINYVALRRTDTPDCGLCYEVDACLGAALNALGLQGQHRHKEVISGVHQYRLLDDMAIDFALGQFDPTWIGRIVVEEAAAFSRRIDLAIHQGQPAHGRAYLLSEFRRLRERVELSQAA